MESRKQRSIKTALLLTCLLSCSAAFSDTVVTTYVTKVQEERKSTRWTLTEWLRIKERMKMMDVWLAMFSDPKKDDFRPELNLVYGQTRGIMKYTGPSVDANDTADIKAVQAKGQLWFTNLFTGSTGVRMLNIDFGVEGFTRQTEDYEAETQVEYDFSRRIGTRYWAGAFRVFGKNIQDSSLSLKVGQYDSVNTLTLVQTDETANVRIGRRGMASGAELQLYVFRWLGVEGNYMKFDKATGISNEDSVRGEYYDYLAYVEISLFRFMGGYYGENWNYSSQFGEAKTQENGIYTGMKLQI
jgi:hypothetical protein